MHIRMMPVSGNMEEVVVVESLYLPSTIICLSDIGAGT